jgi:hypothetical protein
VLVARGAPLMGPAGVPVIASLAELAPGAA